MEDSLNKKVAMSLDLRHVCMSSVIPTSPLSAVDESDEFHQELMEDGQWAVVNGDGSDNQIHVDTEV
jgi:hypothetical protein